MQYDVMTSFCNDVTVTMASQTVLYFVQAFNCFHVSPTSFFKDLANYL